MATTTATCSWGADGLDATYGIVVDCTLGNEMIHQPLENETGAVIGTSHYDTRKTISMTVQAKTAATLPTPGSQITVDGEKYACTRVDVVYSNKDYKKLRIEGEAYDNWSGTAS